MLQDIRAGRETEINSLNVEICRRGEMFGIPTPLNRSTIIDHSRFFDEVLIEVQTSVFLTAMASSATRIPTRIMFLNSTISRDGRLDFQMTSISLLEKT